MESGVTTSLEAPRIINLKSINHRRKEQKKYNGKNYEAENCKNKFKYFFIFFYIHKNPNKK